MAAFNRILHPTDFSAAARAALPVALALARDGAGTLVLLHVRPVVTSVVGEFGAIAPEPRESDASVQGKLQALLPLNWGGRVVYRVGDGDAAGEIVRAANENRCDMIVMGTHGRTGLARFLVGSVAESVLRQAPCPVLTMKPTSPIETPAAEGEPELAESELATVCTVASPIEAEVVRNALRDEGIGSFIEGATQAGIVGTLGIPIKVQVRAGDYNRASKFIRTREAHRSKTV